MNLGVLLLDSGQTQAALAAFTASVGSWNAIAAKNPESNFELANAHGWVARTHERVGNFQSALKSLDAKVAAIQARPNASANSKLESLLAGSHYDAARMHLALGQADSARQAASASIQRFTRLVDSDPENLDWLLQLCQSKLELADALDTASLTQAIAPFERLNRDVERLLLQGGGNKLLPKNVALKARWLLLDARKNPSKYTQSRGEPLLAFIQEVGVLSQAGKTLSPSQQGAVARVELLLGDLLNRTSPPQAHALWERVSATLLPASEKGDIPLTVMRAHALARLGKTQELQSLVERLKASDYKHPLYAELLTFIANTSSQGNAT